MPENDDLADRGGDVKRAVGGQGIQSQWFEGRRFRYFGPNNGRTRSATCPAREPTVAMPKCASAFLARYDFPRGQDDDSVGDGRGLRGAVVGGSAVRVGLRDRVELRRQCGRQGGGEQCAGREGASPSREGASPSREGALPAVGRADVPGIGLPGVTMAGPSGVEDEPDSLCRHRLVLFEFVFRWSPESACPRPL